MEEYELMEKELKSVYETYLERFRNVAYLESELNKYNSAEMEKKMDSDRALKRMQKRSLWLSLSRSPHHTMWVHSV